MGDSLLSRLVQRTGVAPAPNGRIAAILWRKGVADSQELVRILRLPRRVLDPATVPDLTPLFLHTPFCRSDGKPGGCDLCARGPARLWPLQSAILLDAEARRGAFGPMPVGSGKTLASLLLADALGAKRAALLVPPAVRTQLVADDIPRLGRHFRLPLDRLVVISYSQLSRAETADALDDAAPDLIIADEAHNLRHRSAAKTKRFMRYMKDRPATMFVPLSGTMTTKSVRDYGHLIELALRAGSPLPNGYTELEDWAAALDSAKEGEEPMPAGELLQLCTDEERAAVAAGSLGSQVAIRAGYRRRLVQTPGVVATSEDSLGSSLVIQKRDVTLPASVASALAEVRASWQVGEEEIDSAATMAAVCRQLACGFYYVWDWPGGVADRDWLDARRAWNRAVRTFLAHSSRVGLDSPMLVAQAAARGKLPSVKREWEAWVEVKDRPQPPTKPVWLDPFLVDDAIFWAVATMGDGGGILWFSHSAFEMALRAKAKFPVFGAGESEGLLAARKKDGLSIACSVHAHSTGKNLQAWSKNLVVSPPANGTSWEQLLGRTHRPGQDADEVTCEVYQHTPELQAAVVSALESARYIEETQGARQKLIYATRLL